MISINNIKKCIKKPSLIIPHLYLNLRERYSARYVSEIKKNILQENIIWHFCTPKSASSFLMYMLVHNNTDKISSIQFYENRPQVSDFLYLNNNIVKYKYFRKKTFHTHHQHSIFDNYLNQYLSHKHKVIIQTRNIFETVLSLKDYLISTKKLNTNPWFFYKHSKYSEKDILKLLIFNYIPFHIQFIISWFESETRAEKIFINYRDLIKNPEANLKKIFGEKKIINKDSFDLNLVDKEYIKLNIGLKRKNTLSDEDKKLINDIVETNIKNLNPQIKRLIYQ